MDGVRITFLGAAQTVTGSRYLLESPQARILVDCGLFQGTKALRQRNWAPLPFDPHALDAVVLSHAHIDHSGYLPLLCKRGFRGPVFCTEGTKDLLAILLPDSGWLQEEQARHANEHRWSKHRPALPLYTRADAEASLAQLRGVAYGESFEAVPSVRVRFTRAGHILGSACPRVEIDGRTIAFSGDVGRPHDPIMLAPDPLPAAGTLVVESTYGDRRHPAGDVSERIETVINDAVERKGVVLVPAFAVGRAQHLLHLVERSKRRGRIPDVPVFLDSPMSIDATRIFCRHREDHRLREDECQAMCGVAQYTSTPEESKAIDRRPGPMVVISASGMATGGRILHHLQRFLPDERNVVLVVGFQAEGTRGRSLVDGADELKIFGRNVPVRARVEQVQGLSAHADRTELVDWLARSGVAPRRVFVSHGEPGASDAFRRTLADAFGWNVAVPEHGETFQLPPDGATP